MKKYYVTLFIGLLINQFATAQLSLTKAFNEPIIGNSETKKGYDSLTAVVPKATGAGLTWNFTNFAANTSSSNSTYVAPLSVPASSAFTGVTIVENQGGGTYNYWKSTATNYELLGTSNSTISFNYSGSSAIAAVWPISLSYTNTDVYSGTVGGSFLGTLSGTINTNATGTGTLIIPGGTIFTNILQTRTSNTVDVFVTSPISTTLSIVGIDYNYYHGSQKFPLMTVSYENQGTGNTGKIWLNAALLTGLNDKNFDATFAIYPNPAKDAFNLTLSNTNHENCTLLIYNSIGQIVRSIELGTASALEKNINISDLQSGIYFVKTSLGEKTSTRRLIVE